MAHSLELFVSVLEKNIDNRGKTPPLSPTGYPLIEVKHIQKDRLYPVFEDTKYVDQETWDTWFRSHLMPGDILFSTVGSIARSCMVPEKPRFCIAQNVLGFRVNRTKADPRFLYYAINDSFFQHEVHGRAIETVQKSIKVHDLKTCRIPLPSLAEQKAIAEVLGALDDKIELNRKMNATLEAMTKALFKSWFVDFDPVRAKLDGRRPEGLDDATASLFPDSFEDSALGGIPKGWRPVGLPEVIDFLEGPGLRNWQYRDEGMKFLNIRCIGDGDLDIAKANCISLDEFEKTYRHFALQENDIVLSTSGTLGRLAIVRDDHLPVMLNTSIIRMRGRNAVSFGYLWGLLQSEYFIKEMFSLAAGSVQLNFGPMHLRKISILRPPDGILGSFESMVQPLLRKYLRLRKESRTLANLRDTLLPKLLSGELSVDKIKERLVA